jgi:hypothetical protein
MIGPEVVEILNELRHRLRRLEEKNPRKSLNLREAAEYLGRSDEWLRREHLAGRGPKRRRLGARNWSYRLDDLDAYFLPFLLAFFPRQTPSFLRLRSRKIRIPLS